MTWLYHLDASLFHGINSGLSNGFFDWLMPLLSGNALFLPGILVIALYVLARGGARGRLCVAAIFLAVVLGDTFVCNTIKQIVHRPRPFWVLSDAILPPGIGRSDSGSMPSSHAANWFAATMVCFIYYRRSLRFMLPLAVLVCFSRVYNGVHYPSDILAGAIFGAGYAAMLVWLLDRLWHYVGTRWFPLWWQKLPSLLHPEGRLSANKIIPASPELRDRHWIRLAFTLITAEFIGNLLYLASGKIELSGDETYQWVWSKHLALSYYSKPLLIAVTQFLGTHLWGDTTFGIRFFSPVLATITAIALFQFLRKVAGVRVAFWVSVITPAIPILAVGSVLMTIDPLSVMFWVLAMIAGWKALQPDSRTRDFLWTGLWMGLGLLSKYHALYQILSWSLFFCLYPPARKHLRRPGPWLALLVFLACSIPILVWNMQHHWITARHVAEGGSLEKGWDFSAKTLESNFKNFTLEFIGAEALLQNPFFFLGMFWAVFAFWRYKAKNHFPLQLYFFSMGAPLYVIYLALTIHSRSQPNWIAPAILPFLCLGAVFWNDRWSELRRQPTKTFLICGMTIGVMAYVVLHDFNLIPKLTGYHFPPGKNPSNRVRGWRETARAVNIAREKLATEGKPVFIIGEHYEITSEVTFNLPDARENVKTNPLVYYRSSDVPHNQYFFWPGYENRHGQNAIYVKEIAVTDNSPLPIPDSIRHEFRSIKILPDVTIEKFGEPVRKLQMAECRDLR